ncbi:enoyl-CoA hydratase/isomerase family protein [Acidihalobacter ferrooxydans]|nr:enoyl-CoA hydratase/isomerase family protein [Acidihalobacter ferrooxydans]
MSIDYAEVAPGIGLLTLNRPPANALSPDLLAELDEKLRGAVKDGARAVVLAGQPGLFSAGFDVPLLLTLGETAMQSFWRTFFEVLRTLATSPIPVGTAITGHCPAGGTVLSLFTDYRIAAQGEFKLGLNEVEVGLSMPPLVFAAFRRLIGARAAEQYAVAGSLIPPAEALACGLVDAVVPPERVVEEALTRAAQLAALPPNALAATRALARADLVDLFNDLSEDLYREMNVIWFGTETQTAMRALLNRIADNKKRADA